MSNLYTVEYPVRARGASWARAAIATPLGILAVLALAACHRA
ncbi:MAG: hypothetical protein QOG17_1993, partial [Gammaproteobacteria bacterium]|nr:hypothetical protein [Gammaproteobacteria bacterium]